jgi:type I restriction enzyme S subunit
MKPGYKQTEVGVIPEDWDVVRIGDLFTFKNGLNKAKQFFGHGTPIVNYMDVFGRPRLRAEAIGGCVDVSPKELNAYEVRKGDMFFTRTSETVEEIGIAAVMLDEPEKTVYSGFVLRARPIDETLDDLFKAYCFSPRYFRQQVTARASYTTRALTNGRSLSAALLARPPKSEQRAIAAALSDVDALLGGLDRLIAKKRDLKQAAMQQLLTGQTRLPGFSATRAFVSDELGTRPQDWDAIPLNELVDPARRIRYGIVQPGEYDRNGRYMIRGQDYSEARGWADPSEVFRVSDAVEQRYRNARVQEGDLIMTIVGYCGHTEIVPAWLDGANLTQTTARIAIQPHKASQVFCKYMLQSAVGRSQVASFLKGAAQPGLNCGDVEKFRLPLPTMREQTAVATVLSDLDAELAALQARRDKTRDLKQAMMHELLTGKTRLVPAGAACA